MKKFAVLVSVALLVILGSLLWSRLGSSSHSPNAYSTTMELSGTPGAAFRGEYVRDGKRVAFSGVLPWSLTESNISRLEIHKAKMEDTLVLNARGGGSTGSAPSLDANTPSELPVSFVPVNPGVTYTSKEEEVMKTLEYRIAYAKAWTVGALKGNKMNWSGSYAPLAMHLVSYRDFVGQSVFVGGDVRFDKVGVFNFSALTTSGLARDFEEAMKTNQIVFVKDKTNAVWVMHATNELAFRRKFGLVW